MLSQDVEIKNGMVRERVFDERLRAPKGGINIEGKEFKGGEFIPSSVDPEKAKAAIEAKKKENEESGEEKIDKKDDSKEKIEEKIDKKDDRKEKIEEKKPEEPSVSINTEADKNLGKSLDTFNSLYERMKPKGYKYSTYSLLKSYGQYFTPQERPSWVKKGRDKECYRNAYNFVISHPEYTYVEGVADCGLLDSSFPINHAWAVDKEGKVIETTWSTPGRSYFGIPFEEKFLLNTTLKTKIFGLIPEFPTESYDPFKNGFPEGAVKKLGTASNSQRYNYFEKNIAADLSKISKNRAKIKSVSGKLSEQGNVNTIVKNSREILEDYSGYLSTDSYGLARDSIYGIKFLLEDPSLGHIDSEYINQMVSDSVKKMIYQEVESNRQQFTDHGIRHIQSNIERMNEILDVVGGDKISAMDKLMGFFIMVNHDVGYTAEEVKKGGVEGAKASGKHKEFSSEILESQRSQWNENKIFSPQQYDKIVEIVKTHDDTTIDKNDLLGTSVRLSDNLSLFSKEKLPSMFKLIKDGKFILTKLGEAAQKKDLKSFEAYRDKMNKSIDSSNINENLKRDLKAAVKEISYLTPKFTMGVLAGEIDNISGDKNNLNIDIKYNAWDSFLQKHFDMGQKQTKKLLGDYGITDFSKTEYDLGGFVKIKINGYNPDPSKSELARH